MDLPFRYLPCMEQVIPLLFALSMTFIAFSFLDLANFVSISRPNLPSSIGLSSIAPASTACLNIVSPASVLTCTADQSSGAPIEPVDMSDNSETRSRQTLHPFCSYPCVSLIGKLNYIILQFSPRIYLFLCPFSPPNQSPLQL